MKKILLLGGSAQQIIAIEVAKKLGFYTVLCDYLTDNPGQFHADKFYLVSTVDRKVVLRVAEEEKIDGVLAYASDPAAPTAAYVAEKLGLPGNPYGSVEILCNKDRFRKFLAENNFCTPKAQGVSNVKETYKSLAAGVFHFPVIVKPVDSSGSKGVTVLYKEDKAKEAIDFAFGYSRGHRIIVEEFIEKKHPYLIGGDIFVKDGKIVLWGLLNCHRDQGVNPLVPVGKSYPLELSDSDIDAVKTTLQAIVDKLEISNGAMNVELVIDKNNRVWPIDIGPRSGGNMIPDLLGMIFGVDVVEMSIKAAMGMPIEGIPQKGMPYYATHNLHSDKNGIYKDVNFSEELRPFIVKKYIYKNVGDPVENFDNAAKALGIIFMKFPNEEIMKSMLRNINKYIEVNLKE